MTDSDHNEDLDPDGPSEIDSELRRWGERARRRTGSIDLAAWGDRSPHTTPGRSASRRWLVPAAAAAVIAAIAIPVLVVRSGTEPSIAPPIAQAPTTEDSDLARTTAPDPSVSGITEAPALSTVPTTAEPTTTKPGTTAAPLVDPAQPAPGMRSVTFHGLTIDVPKSWPTDNYACGPQSDTVLLPGPRDACGPPAQTVTTVEFTSHNSIAGYDTNITVRPGELDGYPAEFASKVASQDSEWSAGPDLAINMTVVPELDALVIITSPDAEVARRLSASLRIGDHDLSSCPASTPDTFRLPVTPAAPEMSGAAAAIFPGTPDSVIVCRYVDGLVEQSSVVTGPDLRAWQTVLAKARAGTWKQPRNTYLPELCRDPDTPSGSGSQDTWMDAEGYRLIARYDSGGQVVAIARLSLCGDLGLSNGSYSVMPTTEVADLLFAAAGNSTGYSSPAS